MDIIQSVSLVNPNQFSELFRTPAELLRMEDIFLITAPQSESHLRLSL